MKYDQLQEAIIKVPQTMLTTVNQYVSSVLYFKIKQYMQNYDRFASREMRTHPAADKIKARQMAECERTLKVLSSKYGAKNISSMTYNNIVGKEIKLPFDAERYATELNFKNIPDAVKSNLQDITVNLNITNNPQARQKGALKSPGSNRYVVLVNISIKPEETYTNSLQIMSTVYHELQHFVQRSIIQQINSKSNQIQMKKDYDTTTKGYMSSGIEYTPQLGNVVDAMRAEMEVMKTEGEVPSNVNDAFNSVLQHVVGRDDKYNARNFMIQVHQTSKKKYREIMTTLYKHFMKNFEEVMNSTDDESELSNDVEELDHEVDQMATLAHIAQEAKRFGEATLYGQSIDRLSGVEYKNTEYDWTVRISPASGKFLVKIASPEFRESGYLSYKQAENYLGYVTAINSSADQAYETLDNMIAEDSDPEEETKNLVKKLGEWTNMIGIQFKPTDDGFVLDDVEYTLDIYNGRISLESSEFPELYWVGSADLITEVMKSILRLLKNNPEAAYAELNKGDSLIKAIRRLRN